MYSGFHFVLSGSDIYTFFLTVDVAQVCMNSCYFNYNLFLCEKNLQKLSRFLKPWDAYCDGCFQNAE